MAVSLARPVPIDRAVSSNIAHVGRALSGERGSVEGLHGFAGRTKRACGITVEVVHKNTPAARIRPVAAWITDRDKE